MFRYTTAAAVVIFAYSCPAIAQDGAPNEVEGIVTNAFAKGFPTTIEDLAQKQIQTNPAEGTIKSIYGNDEDTRYARVELAPMPAGGIAPRFAGLRNAYEDVSDMPVMEFDHASPDGLALDCFTHRRSDQGYISCYTEVRGRFLTVELGAVVDADADALPDEIRERDSELAGMLADSVNAAPDRQGGGADDPLPALSAPAAPQADPPGAPVSADGPEEMAPQDTPFAKALPESIDGRTLKEITARGPRETFIATYEDDLAMQTMVTLYADHGDDPAELRALQKQALEGVIGELRDVEVTSPRGIPVQCFHPETAIGIAHSICTASLDAGIAEVQAPSRIPNDADDGADQAIAWAQDHAGRLIDALATLP
ncbi:hypothetical protein SAMN05421538_11410 [Paracoccus isoporae]|uniref:Uncharacterized protein n=1 Tax=Paracoccus isoporae TaxID=591205 RepID=A0A1G7GM81_9RHOB|nr:hypothetical protein [Paracoccus isoporae]SDE89232.1 hypothetical protein SAMN05421538_11410 [Paracoccus isoporae]